jgi:methylenetetrahydrofolate reductase (NADPH)
MKTFRDTTRNNDFTITAQLKLAEDSDREAVLQQIALLKPVVDAIQVTDNPNGVVHLSPLVVANMALQQGIDPVLHMTCRDRNNIALRSDLLGARALGVNSLLIQRGDELNAGYQPKTKEVFEIGSQDLIAAGRQMGDAQESQDFYIGAVVTAFNPKSGWQAKSLVAKADAGARFLQTQICFDMDVLKRYMDRLAALRLTHRTHLIVSIATLRSGESARWLRDNLRGSVVPKSVIQRLDQAADPEQEGIRLCAELLQEMKEIPGVSGVNLVTPGEIETIPAAIHAANLQALPE